MLNKEDPIRVIAVYMKEVYKIDIETAIDIAESLFDSRNINIEYLLDLFQNYLDEVKKEEKNES